MGYKFPVGRVIVSPGVTASLTRGQIINVLERHARGDWPSGARDTNEQAVRDGSQVFSQFLVDGTHGTRLKVWVLTDEERAKTLVMFPEESAYRASDLLEVPGPILQLPLLRDLF